MERREIINMLKDAILASGKKFKDIPRTSFENFFKKEGIRYPEWDSIYDELCSFYGEPKDKKNKVETPPTKPTPDPQIDYYATKPSTIKKRVPRKNIFGEITKISG